MGGMSDVVVSLLHRSGKTKAEAGAATDAGAADEAVAEAVAAAEAEEFT